MTYEQLENICIALYGATWKPNLAHDLSINRTAIYNWSSQGVPKWLDNEFPNIIEKRKNEVNSIRPL